MFHDAIIFMELTMKGKAIIERTTYWTFLIVGVSMYPLIHLCWLCPTEAYRGIVGTPSERVQGLENQKLTE
jgi:hypothetical protein